ncbi:CGNR zinc finger domain-containing protein [Pseudonocardia spinosispora]|uniref:CGNR zinc finger domain-containing protein n=1 Tax=Pseudonocardia spinosispora TaxID=103441 RepID=UPI00040CB22F|nr:CGNR zinc finger domain-containing protein [Pseudonocardia spinosispora]
MIDLINEAPVDLDDVVRRWAAGGLGPPVPTNDDDFRSVCAFVEEWAEVVDATTEDQRVNLLNALLADSVAYPRITRHDGSGWHVHYRDDGVSLAVILRSVTSVAAAQHLTSTGMHRLGRCAVAECRRAFVDFTQGGKQRYCSHACVNRDAVRRHRARRTAGRSSVEA